MRQRKEKPSRVKFCPSCGSKNVQWELPQTWSVWKCWDCGYVGALIVEDGLMADEVRKDYLERIAKLEPKKKKRKLKAKNKSK